MFYLEDYLTSKKGEEVTGTFTMKPNQRNVRDLDFEITVNFEGELCSVKETNTSPEIHTRNSIDGRTGESTVVVQMNKTESPQVVIETKSLDEELSFL